MQADKNNTDTEKNETLNNVMTSVANEVTNLKMEDGSTSSTPSSPGTTEPGSFLASFKAFSKFGDPKSDGKLITLSQSDKWMKQAKVIDGKKITTTDTGIYFKKHKCVFYKIFKSLLSINLNVSEIYSHTFLFFFFSSTTDPQNLITNNTKCFSKNWPKVKKWN